jgi:PTH1 family peptidyl-tRNA hydrolase
MKAVVGLGNPGPEYAGTRHNVGFRVLAELARRQGAAQPKLKFEAEILEVMVGSEKLLLVAPQTYMNNSGRSVRKLIDFYKLPLDELLIVCDDLNLDTGRLRIRQAGSAGGQKGLSDLISRLGTQEFNRLRIGIGRPPGRMNAADYVLRRFRTEERELVEQAVSAAADAVEIWCAGGVEAAMNRFNAPAQTREPTKGKQQKKGRPDED